MIGRAVEAGVPFSWVAGDEVYGGNPGLRSWLEERGHPLRDGRRLQRADRRPGRDGSARTSWRPWSPRPGGSGCSCADGSKGPRLYDWALIGTASPRPSAAGPPVPAPGREGRAGAGVLPLLVTPPGHPGRAGRRRRRPVGGGGLLRRGQERDRPGPLPGPPLPRLVPPHHPVDAGPRVPRRHRPQRHSARSRRKRGPDACGQPFAPPRTYAPPPFITDETGRDLIPLTAAEARRLFNLHTRVTRPQAFHQHWSDWRRYRQASARKSHYARRTRNHEALL